MGLSKNFVLCFILTYQFSFCQNTDSELIIQIAEKHKTYTDTLREIEKEFLFSLPDNFEQFFELYGSPESLLYKYYQAHLSIFEAIPRNDSLFLHKLISLSINGFRDSDAISSLWELSRFTFGNLRYMRDYCKVLDQFSHEEIKSVFHFFEYDIMPITQFKLDDLVLVKENFPRIYKAYLEVRQELGIKN